jgi:hypothetical protein
MHTVLSADWVKYVCHDGMQVGFMHPVSPTSNRGEMGRVIAFEQRVDGPWEVDFELMPRSELTTTQAAILQSSMKSSVEHFPEIVGSLDELTAMLQQRRADRIASIRDRDVARVG